MRLGELEALGRRMVRGDVAALLLATPDGLALGSGGTLYQVWVGLAEAGVHLVPRLRLLCSIYGEDLPVHVVRVEQSSQAAAMLGRGPSPGLRRGRTCASGYRSYR